MGKIIRKCIFILLGVIGLIWFMLPYIIYRIMIIGNVTGICVSVLLILIGIFQKLIDRLLLTAWKRMAGKIILSIIGVIVTIMILLVIVMSGLMIHAAVKKPQQNATLIVLGCKVCGTDPSLMLEERLQAAYTYLNDHPDAVAILSGGQGSGEEISEAECMYRYLTERKIDTERLLKEDKSTSTRQNLAYSMEILKEHNLDDNVTIVTNEFHEYRASKIAKTLGLKPAAVPGKTAITLFPTYYVRELYGILYEWIM